MTALIAELEIHPEPRQRTQARLNRAMAGVKLPAVNVGKAASQIDDRLKALGRVVNIGPLAQMGGVLKDLGKVAPSLGVLGVAAGAAAGLAAAAYGVRSFVSAALASGDAAEASAQKIAKAMGATTTSDMRVARDVSKYLQSVAPDVTAAAISAFGGLGGVRNTAMRSDLSISAARVAASTGIDLDVVTTAIADTLRSGQARGVVAEALKGAAPTAQNIASSMEALAKSTSAMRGHTTLTTSWASRWAALGARFFRPIEPVLMRFLHGIDRLATRLEPVLNAFATVSGQAIANALDAVVSLGSAAMNAAIMFLETTVALMGMREAVTALTTFIGRIAGGAIGAALLPVFGPQSIGAGAALGGRLGAMGGDAIASQIAALQAEAQRLRDSIDTSSREAKSTREAPIRVQLDTSITWGDSRSLQVSIEDVIQRVAQQAAQRSRVSRRVLPVGG
jgi:hypothetical protein